MLKLDERWFAIGFFTASVAGCTLAITNSLHSWRVFQKCHVIEIPLYGASRDCQTLTIKAKEIPPQGYQLIDQKQGYPDIKMIGLAVAIVAGLASYSWNERLSEMLELAEKQKALELESDTRLLEKGIGLHTQLQERRLTLEIGEKAKEFERLFGVPNLPELEDDRKQEAYLSAEFTPSGADRSQENNAPNPNMLYGWLLSRNLAEGDVRDICRSSIEGHKLNAEQARAFLNELAAQNLIAWLNDQQTKFKLVTEE
jgi:hypothetical protein